ncbi:MAG: hypothetical protein FWH26_05565, partial [Oscillospiraceae bacterium]|nr:hypothetical protein [Oscillospiraceae bacterium]
MKKAKQGVSYLLALLLLMSMVAVGGIGFGVPASAAIEKKAAPADVYFQVPELIYLNPTPGDNGFQYFADSKTDFTNGNRNRATYGTLNNSNANTSGDLWFYCENATQVKIECTTQGVTPHVSRRASRGDDWDGVNMDFYYNDLDSVALSGLPYWGYPDSGTTPDLLNKANHTTDYLLYRLCQYGSATNNGASLTAGQGMLIEWKATYVVDGVEYTACAYSYVYKPLYIPTGVGYSVSRGGNQYPRASWFFTLDGLHVSGEGNRTLNDYGSSRRFLPLIGVVDHDTGTRRMASEFTSAGSGTVTLYWAGDFNNSINGSGDQNSVAKVGTKVPAGNFYNTSNPYNGDRLDTNSRASVPASSGAGGTLYVDTSRYSHYGQIPNLYLSTYMVSSNNSTQEQSRVLYNTNTSWLNNDSWIGGLTGFNNALFRSYGNQCQVDINNIGSGVEGYNASGINWATSNVWWRANISRNNTLTTYPILSGGSLNPLVLWTYCWSYATSGSDQYEFVSRFTPNVISYDKSPLRAKVREVLLDYKSMKKDHYQNADQTAPNANTYWNNYWNAWLQLCSALDRPDYSMGGGGVDGVIDAFDAARDALIPIDQTLEDGVPPCETVAQFNVPELIYLAAADAPGAFRYYVNHTFSGGYDTAARVTSGKIHFYAGGGITANNPQIRYSVSGGGSPSITIAGSPTAPGTWVGITNADNAVSASITAGNLNIAQGAGEYIYWDLRYQNGDGVWMYSHAVTYVYAIPLQTGGMETGWDTSGDGAFYYAWMSGVHLYEGGNSRSKFIAGSSITERFSTNAADQKASNPIWLVENNLVTPQPAQYGSYTPTRTWHSNAGQIPENNNWTGFQQYGNRVVSEYFPADSPGGVYRTITDPWHVRDGVTEMLYYIAGNNINNLSTMTMFIDKAYSGQNWNLMPYFMGGVMCLYQYNCATRRAVNMAQGVDAGVYYRKATAAILRLPLRSGGGNASAGDYYNENFQNSDIDLSGDGYAWLDRWTGTIPATSNTIVIASHIFSGNAARDGFWNYRFRYIIVDKTELRLNYINNIRIFLAEDLCNTEKVAEHVSRLNTAGKTLTQLNYSSSQANDMSGVEAEISAQTLIMEKPSAPVAMTKLGTTGTLTVHHICNTCAESGEALSAAYISTTDGNNYVGGTT